MWGPLQICIHNSCSSLLITWAITHLCSLFSHIGNNLPPKVFLDVKVLSNGSFFVPLLPGGLEEGTEAAALDYVSDAEVNGGLILLRGASGMLDVPPSELEASSLLQPKCSR